MERQLLTSQILGSIAALSNVNGRLLATGLQNALSTSSRLIPGSPVSNSNILDLFPRSLARYLTNPVSYTSRFQLFPGYWALSWITFTALYVLGIAHAA